MWCRIWCQIIRITSAGNTTPPARVIWLCALRVFFKSRVSREDRALFAEAKNNFSRVTAEVNGTGRPVTVLKNNKPWVVISPAVATNSGDGSAVDVAVDFMDEYADVFEGLAK